MARALVQRGHHVTVIHDVDAYEWLAGTRLRSEPRDQDGVEVVALRSRLPVLSLLLTHQVGYPVVHGRTIERLVRERAFDVVVFNNVSMLGGPGLLAFGGDALKVYLAHEHWLVCPTHVLWRFNREPCDARACTRCVLSYRRPPQMWRYTGALEHRLSDVDLFIARSAFSREKHREFGFSKAMRVLPNFVPGAIPLQREPPSMDPPHRRPYFLFVGRLTRMKGLDSIIPAFGTYPDADLLIAGDGEEGNALRAFAKDLPQVKFLGRMANDDLRRYYEHAVAVVVPSSGYETFGIVLVEAFRYGTPVIARRIGPFVEILEQSDGGLLFSNTEELVAALARMQGDTALRARLSTNAYAACRERWSEEIVIGQFLELVSEALAKR